MSNIYSFEGTRSSLYNYLTKELKIAEKSFRETKTIGRHQLTPLSLQIERIYNEPSKSGKIYFTEDFTIKNPNDDTEHDAFQVCTVTTKITD